MARPSNTEERRAEIVQGLLRSMAAHGYAGASIARIAKEAGLAPGLVHYHFESKAEILATLVDDLASRASARVGERVARGTSPGSRLDAALDALLGRGADADEDAVRCWTLVGAQAVTDRDVRTLYARFVTTLIDRLAHLVVEACHAEGRSGEGARAIAGALVATMEGYFALSAAVPDAIPSGSAASMAKRAARGLIAEQPLRGVTR